MQAALRSLVGEDLDAPLLADGGLALLADERTDMTDFEEG